jgi:hypothetical protein
MPDWLLPLAAASLTVLFLNFALCVRRARERSKEWTTRFRRELRRWAAGYRKSSSAGRRRTASDLNEPRESLTRR